MPPPRPPEPRYAPQYREDDQYHRGYKRKKKGFLGEVFDFD